MILEILKPYWKWQPGDTPDVTGELAEQLISDGYARVHEDQRRRDYIPKPPPPEQGEQKIEVNNYYLPPEYYEGEEVENIEKPFFKRIIERIWQR